MSEGLLLGFYVQADLLLALFEHFVYDCVDFLFCRGEFFVYHLHHL